MITALGTRVRIIRDTTDDGSNAWYVGRTGTVVKLDDDLPNWAGIAVDNDPWEHYRAFRLDAIEELAE